MKNIQVIDGGENCTYDIYEATDEEFALLFPGGTDIEFVEDFKERVGEDKADATLGPIWGRPVDKKVAKGIQGTLFFELLQKKKYYPTKRDAEMIAVPDESRLLDDEGD